MSKMYFYGMEDETCTTLEYIKDLISCDNLKEKEVFEAKRITGEGIYWCKHHSSAGDVGDGYCGKMCSDYKPRNGKNGRCIHSGYCYEPHKKVLIKL